MAKITANNIFTGAITSDKLDASVVNSLTAATNANTIATIASTVAAAAFSSANTISAILANTSTPIITSITIADSSYNALDDVAANTTGGYCIITGSGFVSTPTVVFGTTASPVVSFVNSTTLRAQIPALTAASYPVYVVNSNGGTAIKINALTTSSFPAWSTSATLTTQATNTAFSITLSATSDSNITYSNTTTLPQGTTLLANGYFYGNVFTSSTYTFNVAATDGEYQNANRTFTLPTESYAVVGQQVFTTTTQSIGDYSYFTVPAGVTAISAVVIGGGGGGCRTLSAGGGGSGGDLRWIKSIAVTPGEILRIDVGAGGAAGSTGNDGYFSGIQRSNGFVILQASGGGGGTLSSVRAQYGGSYGPSTTPSETGAVGPIGGGNGGNGGSGVGSANAAGGGGAGGYLGNGGNGASATTGINGTSAESGGGGGGGGGAAGSLGTGGTGGGVGLLGWGSDGTGGIYGAGTGFSGSGGSGGDGGGNSRAVDGTPLYGAGGGGDDTNGSAHNGAQGAVRIIWPAQVRYYPYTRTANE